MKIRSNKRYIAFSMIFLLLFSIIQIPSRSYAQDTLDVHADAAIIIEPTTGKVLYGKNIDTPLGIASMTKMMTEYLMFEAIEQKKISWEQEVTISDKIYEVSQDTSLSNVPLLAGEPYTIRELYEALAIYSANGATMAIAEAIAGTESKFVEMMNAKAEELGLEHYKFVNSTGLNNASLKGKHPEGTGPDDENMMSARSTAQLAARLLRDYPQVLETASIPKKKFRDIPGEMKNWNKMLPSLLFEYPGVDGLKTGTTDFAGHCFTGTATRGDFRVITVVMGATDANGNETERDRFDETKKLMEYAFNNYSMKEILPANYQVKDNESLAVDKGKEKSVKIQTDESLTMVVKNGEEKAYQPVLTIDKKKLNKEGELTAPIKKGEQIGTLEISYQGQEDLGFVSDNLKPVVKVVAAEDVEKANWFVLMMRGIGGFFSNLWTGITDTVKGWF
ncbi:serine hydrolase [Bacillus niameyensis]|uniref:serine hydrolase n=1 Tax=Bacillus niameyensis TaxID=1522308 RepID=UPI000A4FD0A9|nr:serine hydrolase [Bacillus niameyensis]